MTLLQPDKSGLSHISVGPITFDSGLLAKRGALEVRLARSEDEITACQRLRHQVFFQDRGFRPRSCHVSLDQDQYDPICDHLIVVDTSRPSQEQAIVGTYRLLNLEGRSKIEYYASKEFKIQKFLNLNRDKKCLELGRSCVARSYRHRKTIELLWRGLWAYVQERKVDILFGCASFCSSDQMLVDRSLAYLREFAAAPPAWGIVAHYPRPQPVSSAADMVETPRQIFAALPPLLKAYLRVGARVSQDATEDEAFGTIDVFVALQVRDIARRYTEHYSS